VKKSNQESTTISPIIALLLAVLLVVSVATLAGYRLNLSAELDGKGKFQINLDPPPIQEAKK
jgi:hypothetical protein